MTSKERIKELQTHINDERIQIKRFKNRDKFELYLHDPEFREMVSLRDVIVPGEEQREPVIIKKKILFYHLEYGIALQSFFKFFSLNQETWDKAYSYRFLKFLEDEVVAIVGEVKEEDENPWGYVYTRLKKRLETLNFESKK